MRRADSLIVGGGPAGAAAAIMLAVRGTRSLLVERTTAPHDMVCGGFLGRDALASLARLGIDVAALGARRITRVRLVAGTRRIEAALPFAAAGLSRRTLDAALLARAAEKGAHIERGRVARHADADGVHFADGETILAGALLLATGKHELRGLARPKAAQPALGLRVALAATPALTHALAETIELHLFDGGYAGLLLQEDGSANLCISIEGARGRGGPALLDALAPDAPLLAERAQGPRGEWSAVAQVPYGWRATGGADGLYRVGDQAAVIASLAGDGVAIALASGMAAADAIARGTTAPAYQRAFAAQARRPLAIAGAVRAAAEHRALRPAAFAALARAPWLTRTLARLTRIS